MFFAFEFYCIFIIFINACFYSAAGMCLFLELGFSSIFWSLSLIGWTFNSVAGTCCTTVHTKFHGILAAFCPCDMSHEVQQVELRATCRGDKISPKLVLHNYKSISLHEGRCHCNISLGHVPATFSCVCKCFWFCPCYMSPLHVPATCRLSVHCTSFLSLQHVPATWTLVSAHLYAKNASPRTRLSTRKIFSSYDWLLPNPLGLHDVWVDPKMTREALPVE